MCGSDTQCQAALDLSCWQQIPSSKSANHHVLPASRWPPPIIRRAATWPSSHNIYNIIRIKKKLKRVLPIKRHELALPRWSRSSSGAAMAEDTARYTSSDLPSIMSPFTLHLACLPGFGGGDAGHLMRIRMTSLSLQPNDASTLRCSHHLMQCSGVVSTVHSTSSFTHSFSLSSSSHLHAEQKSRTCMVYVQYRCHSWPVHQLCMVQIKRPKGAIGLSQPAIYLKRPFFSSLGY
jgi:hypothetical protein